MKAQFEVRITPLMRGVEGELESTVLGFNAAGATHVAEEDTTLVTQFLDLEVTHQLNEPRTGRVVLSIHDPIVAALEPWQQAVWIAYKRPLETLPEAILYGQCNVITDYDAQTVTLDIQDPALRVRRHYIRRGDEALNVDANRGRLATHAESIRLILDAARNIPAQQDRGVPVLGISDAHDYYSADFEEAPSINFERGQECWDLIEQIVRAVGGPDFDMFPRWFFPTEGAYCYLWTYDPADPPPDLTGNTLARDLDPVDPDDLAPGEVVFDYGLGQDNLVGLVEEPGIPTTHVHVLDEPAAYRETSADADSSHDVGIFTDWIGVGFAIQRPTRAQPTADTSPLRALADAHIKAYGRPPRHLTATLRPDDALGFHYGHPEWQFAVPEGVEYIGGEWYIGDYVRVRGLKGERSISSLNRITKVDFKYDLERDLVLINVELIPAAGGTPSDDDEGDPDSIVSQPTIDLTSPYDPQNVSGSAFAVTATAGDNIEVAHVKFYLDGVLIGTDTEAPYGMTWDTTTASDGNHIFTATVTDTAGNTASDSSEVGIQNIAPTVSVTAPAAAAVVSGTAVTITATAAGGGSGVWQVKFYVDGALIAPVLGDLSAPYSTTWNSTTVANGVHLITATARDNDGQITTSAAVSVTVAN